VKQKPNTTLILTALFLLFLNSCVEPYWPDLGMKYEKILVVDGMITDEAGPYTIRLSYSSPLRYVAVKPVTGCMLILTDNTGYSETLNETNAGEYVTTNPAFQGIIGRQYKLTIYTPDDKTYESPFQELKSPVGIDTVYAELESKPNPDGDNELEGYQFFVSSETAIEDTNYFLWALEQTYQFNANYRARLMFDGQMHHVSFPTFNYTCWKTEPVTEVFTFNTGSLGKPVIKDFPLHYVSTETKAIFIKYSLLVKQLRLTKAAYDYWDAVQKQIEGQGALYDRQPYQIRGNISNINNPDEPVLGYFFTAGISEKRIFVEKPKGVHFHFNTTCGYITEEIRDALYRIRSQWPVYLFLVYGDDGGGVGAEALPNSQACVDCREAGGVIARPEFWED